MSDSIRRVERLSSAACEIATRNHNAEVGPDHLLYVLCSTEDGRRAIEKLGGDFRAIIKQLKQSFMQRSEGSVVPCPEFTPQYHAVITEPVVRYKEGKIQDINVSDVLDVIIKHHTICPVTTHALISGSLVDDIGTDPDADREYSEQIALALRASDPSGSEVHADGEVGDTIGEGESTPSVDQSQSPDAADPHVVAMMRSLRNLSKLAHDGKLDPVIGRDDEIYHVVDVLQRRRKGNILMVGEPGVGKTAIAEGVAQLLARGEAPTMITDRPVLEVSITDLLAGTKYRGDFEMRLRHLISFAQKNEAILFIDEAHMLMGAGGGSTGAVDASNILKPALARGGVQVIAATTSVEARVIRKDRAMMRRFELLHVSEPTPETSVDIVQRVTDVYSAHHGISYDDDVAERCVELSVLFMPDKKLPDKALDVLDAAAVEAKNAGATYVSREFVTLAISAMTGVNIGRPTPKEISVVKNFSDHMSSKIYGQDRALERLNEAVRISQTGVSSLNVAGSYLFNGPTGVGKTETAKAMAQALGVPFVRFDMSEYMEPHSVSRLIGAPPGYVGYEEDGALIMAAEAYPKMVILFDEIDKAHRKIDDILLQILDEGRVTSGDGRTVSMRGAHIILTGNIGTKEAEKAPLGFGRSVSEEEVTEDAIQDMFRKELLSRIAHKIHFEKLGEGAVEQMVDRKLNSLVTGLSYRGTTVTYDASVVAFISRKAPGSSPTGRNVVSLIDKYVAQEIAKYLIENEDALTLNVSVVDEEIKVSS